MGKTITIKELHLCSFSEKKAKKVVFGPKKNLITGPNRTGKSAISKSIYYALGAEVEFNKQWDSLEVNTALNFTVDDKDFWIFRKGTLFKLFDSNLDLIGSYTSVTTELTPVLSKIFKYNLTLTSRSGASETVPPAFVYLPFYIDQDRSWLSRSTLNTFKNLGQYAQWKKDVIEYHLGVRPDEYYRLKGQVNELNVELGEFERELTALNSVLAKQKEGFESIDVQIDVELFKKEIEQLLVSLNELKKYQEGYIYQLGEIYSQKNQIDKQLAHAKEVHLNLSDDLRFTGQLKENIDCPTCGAIYQNDFEERFSIAQDIGDISSIVCELELKNEELKKDIENKKKDLDSFKNKIVNIESQLNSKKEKLTLKEYIQSEARKEAQRSIEGKISDVHVEMLPIKNDIEVKSEKLKTYQDKERVKSIKGTYVEYMEKFLHDLKVFNLPQKSYSNYTSNIAETGSDLPRAILAFHFSLLYTIIDHNKGSLFAPFVIDSPNQGAQDDYNLPVIYDFIVDNAPSNCQLILAAEEVPSCVKGQDFQIIKVDKKYSLLEEDEFAEESKLFSQLLVKS